MGEAFGRITRIDYTCIRGQLLGDNTRCRVNTKNAEARGLGPKTPDLSGLVSASRGMNGVER